MKMSLDALLNTDFTFQDLTGVHISSQSSATYDYSKHGRHKNMIYYCERGNRHYRDRNNAPLFTVEADDILFVADKANYISYLSDSDVPASGIVISFHLATAQGEPIEITDTFRVLAKHANDLFYHKISRLYFHILQNQHALSIKAAFYNVLNALLTNDSSVKQHDFKELSPAIAFMEAHPEKNVSVKELALMCCMSESCFAHKFIKYSNGIPPLQFRNRIRIMRAEEMANDANLSIESIAKGLGFYDASYLCRFYKKHTGKTLKKRHFITEEKE